MNTRNVVGAVIALIALAVVAYIRFGYGGDRTEETIAQYALDTKVEFLASIDSAPFMQDNNRAYVERLADENHERAWADNHRVERPAGAQVECIIDDQGYARDMLEYMSAAVQADNPDLAEAMLRVRANQFSLE